MCVLGFPILAVAAAADDLSRRREGAVDQGAFTLPAAISGRHAGPSTARAQWRLCPRPERRPAKVDPVWVSRLRQ